MARLSPAYCRPRSSPVVACIIPDAVELYTRVWAIVHTAAAETLTRIRTSIPAQYVRRIRRYSRRFVVRT
ncbi:low-affinity phosphate transporter lipoprotein transmembrane [Leifsonia xyli subsp. cynodontis DSM 46306]|uniref:Uncharacterized protein n=1 Tax=Leifsonia xyli subsp. cynodontis DSM 46306 TaxID=1389489 RepID=U3PBD2_LEIXC|nr:low-affinity phosphate transporter lipoprotein transmembrane [Leifsonia xyli subsp. cynodontis DSM 46306]